MELWMTTSSLEEVGGGWRRLATMTFGVCLHHLSRRTAMPSVRPDDG